MEENKTNKYITSDNECVLGVNIGKSKLQASIFKYKAKCPELLINPKTKNGDFSSTIYISLKDEDNHNIEKNENNLLEDSINDNEINKNEHEMKEKSQKELVNEKIMKENNYDKEKENEDSMNDSNKKDKEIEKQKNENDSKNNYQQEKLKNKDLEIESILKYNSEKSLMDLPILPDDSHFYNQASNSDILEQQKSFKKGYKFSQYNKEENDSQEKLISEKDVEQKENQSTSPIISQKKEIVIDNIKNIIGCRFKQSQDEIKKIIEANKFKLGNEKNLFSIFEGKNGEIKIMIKGEEYSPEQLLSNYLLKEIIKVAETKSNKKVACLVISVPISFNISQRNAILEAGILTKIKIIKIINDPLASVLNYAYSNRCTTTDNFLVIDMGASKFEATVISNKNNKYFKTLAVRGDSTFGGEYFTQNLIKYCKDEFKKKKKGRDPKSEDIIQKLRDKCEEAKIKLCEENEVKIEIENFDGNFDLNIVIQRKKFEEKCLEGLKKIKSMIETVVKESKENFDKNEKLKQKDEKEKKNKIEPTFSIQHVLLLGKASNLPMFSEYVKKEFESTDIISDEDDYIQKGASIYGAYFTKILKTGYIKELKIYGITLLSLGIRVEGDLMSVVIPRGSRIPIQARKGFVTTQDNQTVIKLEVFEGERKLTKDNNFLCRTVLKKLSQKRKGEVKIDVIFEINEEGILKIKAYDIKNENSGIESESINIGNLRQEEVDIKVRQAEENKKIDIEEEERIKAMILLNNLILEKAYYFENDESKKKIIDYYRNWMKHSPNASKEQFIEKYKELISEIPDNIISENGSQYIESTFPQIEEEKKEIIHSEQNSLINVADSFSQINITKK